MSKRFRIRDRVEFGFVPVLGALMMTVACSTTSSAVTADAGPTADAGGSVDASGNPGADSAIGTHLDSGPSTGTDSGTDSDSGTSPGADSGGGYDDGFGNASACTPQFPDMLSGYAKRPPWHVAGVDYCVGLPAGTILADPSTASLPAGCSYASSTVTCMGDGITISGYDFSLHDGLQLVFLEGSSDITITKNNFAVGSTCVTPVILRGASGATVITYNTMDGGATAGSSCSLLFDGLVAGTYTTAGSVLTFEYNVLERIPEDGTDNAGPSTGSASIVEKYNLWYIQGFNGHPDGIQLNGGNFDPITFEFNTYYIPAGTNGTAGTQPFHIEAQLTAAINHSTVAYNTMVTPGSCNGGTNFPTGCDVNFDIACKQDMGSNTNTSFAAYGNYIDWSGAVAALTNGYGCPNTTWGNPIPNYDLQTGLALAAP